MKDGDNIIIRLKELCKNNGTSLTKLCFEVTGSKGNLTTWNKGNIRNDYLLKIAEKFNVSTDYLLTGEESADITKGPADNDEANELMREMYERPELRALFKTTKGVKPEDIKYVDDMLKRFKEGYRDD